MNNTETKKKIYKCPYCKTTHTQGRGSNMTLAGPRARRQCKSCGRTFYADENEVK